MIFVLDLENAGERFSPLYNQTIMLTLDPKEVPVGKMHSYLLGAVTPRPIAFASTVDRAGTVNLSPFSFFNCFGANPPLLVFSPSRRVRNNTTKHTYDNVREHPEVVINVVTYSMVQQASLASTEYPKGVNEFVKAGFTAVPSEKVKPPRVGESPVSMECKVLQVISTGDQGGAGNLVICQILLMHINEEILDAAGKIDPYKLDVVARLGGDYYARIHADSIFTVPKPLDKMGIGIDQLPPAIRNSKILTGNDLAMLANVEKMPEVTAGGYVSSTDQDETHRLAKKYLEEGRIADAWQVLLMAGK
jgi:flavin reductase (DIM6/NTAB) family NADH-FMN oxidoreductase RutF